VTFWVPGGTDRAFAVIDALELIDISNNLGDAKSLVTHPASTTHHRIGPEVRAAMGGGDGVIRISVGLEDVADLQDDLDHALRACPRPRRVAGVEAFEPPEGATLGGPCHTDLHPASGSRRRPGIRRFGGGRL